MEKEEKISEVEPIDSGGGFKNCGVCGNCVGYFDNIIEHAWIIHEIYCDKCGKKVKWDETDRR